MHITDTYNEHKTILHTKVLVPTFFQSISASTHDVKTSHNDSLQTSHLQVIHVQTTIKRYIHYSLSTYMLNKKALIKCDPTLTTGYTT